MAGLIVAMHDASAFGSAYSPEPKALASGGVPIDPPSQNGNTSGVNITVTTKYARSSGTPGP
jgi:hypothetical protein